MWGKVGDGVATAPFPEHPESLPTKGNPVLPTSAWTPVRQSQQLGSRDVHMTVDTNPSPWGPTVTCGLPETIPCPVESSLAT